MQLTQAEEGVTTGLSICYVYSPTWIQGGKEAGANVPASNEDIPRIVDADHIKQKIFSFTEEMHK